MPKISVNPVAPHLSSTPDHSSALPLIPSAISHCCPVSNWATRAVGRGEREHSESSSFTSKQWYSPRSQSSEFENKRKVEYFLNCC